MCIQIILKCFVEKDGYSFFAANCTNENHSQRWSKFLRDSVFNDDWSEAQIEDKFEWIIQTGV